MKATLSGHGKVVILIVGVQPVFRAMCTWLQPIGSCAPRTQQAISVLDVFNQVAPVLHVKRVHAAMKS